MQNEPGTGSQAPKKKPVEPTLHFRTEPMKIGEDQSGDEIIVAELVLAGQLLASFPGFAALADRGYNKVPLEGGDYTEWGEDQESLHAAVPGYPKVRRIRRPEVSGSITVVAIEPLLQIAPDKMAASLVIHPPLEEGHNLRNENLEELLAGQKIVFGINPQALAEARQIIAAGEREFNRVVIASGQPIGQSTDAYLRFAIEVGPIAGTILADGSIDYRERRVMVGISAGQLIATKIPARQGEPGINVFGEETPAREGKDLKVELLNDAKYSPTTRLVTATRDGVLSVVNNSVIKVCSHQVINANIDYETGNVESLNSVTVNGSVQPGFRLDVAGDLKITGGVMSARLNCGGNLVVSGGITGKNSVLKVEGDTDISFIEQGSLEAGGIVVIRRQCYYSRITSLGNIRCPPAAILMGGNLTAAGNLTIGEVGGEHSEPARLAAGVVPERLVRLEQLQASIVAEQEAIIGWLQRFRGNPSSRKVRAMERDLAETKLQVQRLNLIPGSGVFSRVTGTDGQPIGDGEEYQGSGGIDIQAIRIDVHGTILAGTEIRIGNRTMKLDKTVSGRRFRLNPTGRQIIAAPLRG